MIKNNNERLFVLDETNKKAYELVETISKAATLSVYNPAIVYGKTGNGKTHLMNLLKEKLEKAGKKVLLLTSEEFLAQFIYALRNMPEFSTEKFCGQFTEADVLIVEDLQYIQGRTSTQREMVHILEVFMDNQKQIVLTMDRDPKMLDTFETELQEKLNNSVLVSIEDSTIELRQKIAKSFCAEKGWEMPETAVQKIAASTKTVAEVLGVMKRIMFYVEEMNDSLEKILDNLQDYL